MEPQGKNQLESDLLKLQKEKIRLENDLTLIHERLDLSLSAGNLAWWEMNVQTGMVTFNKNKILMLGYTEEEFGTTVHYQKFMELVHPDDNDIAMNAMRDHMNGKSNLYEVEYRIRMKNGKYKWFYDRGSITDYDENKRPLIIKGIVFDNSERKKAEEELIRSESKLRNANLAKDRFFSIIAHDLRSPFTSLLGLTDLLYEKYHDFSENKKIELLKNLQEVSNNTYNLLINLLDWSRAESDGIKIHFSNVNLHNIVGNVLDLMEANANKKEIEMSNDIHPDLTVHADRNLTETVIRNLVSNAIKYTKNNGFIRLEGTDLENRVEVCVIDNGVGIPPNKVNFLFCIDRKYQTPGTNDESGTGLGLIVCKEFMEKNKGEIWVESTLNVGTTFHLQFRKAKKMDEQNR